MRAVIVFVFFLILFFFPHSIRSQQKSTYVDVARGYEIEYPRFMRLRPGSYRMPPSLSDTDYVSVSFRGEQILHGELDELVSPASDLRSFAIELAIKSEASSGPNGDVWCESIDSADVMKNANGVRYVELFLRKWSNDRVPSRSEIVGPYFVVDISTATTKRSLYLDWRPGWRPTPLQIRASKAIAEGVKMLGN